VVRFFFDFIFFRSSSYLATLQITCIFLISLSDFGYVELYGDTKQRCVKDVSDTSPGVKSEWCKPGDLYYNRTKGYRKIPGDLCQGGESETYLPTTTPCAVG